MGNKAFATHNRAGEILFRQISKYTFEITIITYTRGDSPIDREKLPVDWGDTNTEDVNRTQKINLGNKSGENIIKNVYVADHTYAGPGKYTISMQDPNRIGGIVNMEDPINTPFYVQSQLVISQIYGYNNSPILLQPPIDFANVGEKFVHYPNAYDPDGDSLKFSLIPPMQSKNTPVNGYTEPSASKSFSINPYTGELVWETPEKPGIYNIAILIEEFRTKAGETVKMGYVVRDMQIIVAPAQNKPPIIEEVKDTCVEAGTQLTLKVPVKAYDPDSNNVTLTATGGPFLLDESPAQFTSTTPAPSVTGEFKWDVTCAHIRKRPYRVVFKALDDHFKTPLSDLEHFDIKVVGPAPKNLTIEPKPDGMRLDWSLPNCTNPIGYKIYRKVDSSFWDHSYCETGVPGYTGYRLIKMLTEKDDTFYMDNNVSPATIYCYKVTALYKQPQHYEYAEGYASPEVCARLRKDVPVITHVDVLETDQSQGRIFIDWTKPNELDSDVYQPPYYYELYRGSGFNGASATLLKKTDEFSTFQELISQLADTSLVDSIIDTRSNPVSYRIDFYGTIVTDSGDTVKSYKIGSSRVNSSVFLSISPTHEALNLSWNENVIWINKKYVVFKKDTSSGQFFPLDTVTGKKYKDTGLTNGDTYCYFIRSIGEFSAPGFFDSLVINNSQEACARPRDTFPPCPPVLAVEPDCENISNNLTWSYDLNNCDGDVTSYKVYHKFHRGDQLKFVETVQGLFNQFFLDDRDTLNYSLAGCYVVTAVDSLGNESKYSNEVCVDNCSIYELPNVFTPNGDNVNDKFVPMRGWKFVEMVDFKVYNRWGQMVYQTKDPELNWDGTNMNNGKELAPGVYFYDILIWEKYLDGLKSRRQTGSITLLR